MMRSLLFALLLLPTLAFAGEVQLTCTAPTTNTDGTALTNLAGFRFYAGTSPTNLTQAIQVANPAKCETKLTSLAVATWYFAATAYTADGRESAYSNIVSRVITAVPAAVPNPPDSLSVVATTAYAVIKRVDRFVMLPVGTVPADTQCDVTQSVNGYYVVPRAKVTFTGNVQPDVVVAQCL